MNDPVIARRTRRRRTWYRRYRRRLRIQNTLIAGTLVLLLVGVCWQNVARYLNLPRIKSSDVFSDSFWARHDIHRALATAAGHASSAAWRMRKTYPFSVIPGGVRDANELREIAARDYVVRRHYAHFNYNRANLIHAREARLVYMSYRRGDNIFWTRKRVRLHPDELLLTDGVITARARCGNQISESPKPEVAEEEPDEKTLDLPVAELQVPPLPFRSSLTRPNLPSVNAVPPSGFFATNFNFPYIAFTGAGGSKRGVCETPEQERWEDTHGISDKEKGETICKHKRKHPVVPEPSSLLLLSSGLAAVCWHYRRLRVR